MPTSLTTCEVVLKQDMVKLWNQRMTRSTVWPMWIGTNRIKETAVMPDRTVKLIMPMPVVIRNLEIWLTSSVIAISSRLVFEQMNTTALKTGRSWLFHRFQALFLQFMFHYLWLTASESLRVIEIDSCRKCFARLVFRFLVHHDDLCRFLGSSWHQRPYPWFVELALAKPF